MSQHFISVIIIFALCISCSNQSKETTKESKEAITQVVTKETPVKVNKKKILFFGDSLTAGYGLDEEESFPSLIQYRIDSLGLPYEVINAGLSGETSAGGKGRINWVLNQAIDVFVLELGANDVLRGLDLKETNKNLRFILDEVKKANPDAALVIAGMEAPPNMGGKYTSDFRKIFATLATEYKAGLIPFLLDKVAGIPELNLGDAKHPNALGQKIVRENVWDVLVKYIDIDGASLLSD